MKCYQEADSSVADLVTKLMKKRHPDMVKHEVKVAVLFVYDDEDSEKPAVSLHGRECLATISITSAKNRAAGMADALILLDRTKYLKATDRRRESLLAHELHHLVLKPKETDGAGRPKLVMREHDHQFGWFEQIARDYGDDAWEVVQAREIMRQAGQLYFGVTGGEIVPLRREDLDRATQRKAAAGK
jgi:hypothetical protein